MHKFVLWEPGCQALRRCHIETPDREQACDSERIGFIRLSHRVAILSGLDALRRISFQYIEVGLSIFTAPPDMVRRYREFVSGET
jgi:hypothetical protein